LCCWCWHCCYQLLWHALKKCVQFFPPLFK
jgi:hypothetical protein